LSIIFVRNPQIDPDKRKRPVEESGIIIMIKVITPKAKPAAKKNLKLKT